MIAQSHISNSLKLVKIHKNMYLDGVDDGVLLDHFVSLKHGLKFLGSFLKVSENEDLIKRIEYLVSNVEQKLNLVRNLEKDESLAMNLEHAYADLREEMKNVIIKPGTNEYDMIFPEIFPRGYVFSKTSVFLCEKIKKLVTSDCKVNQITPMVKELEDIWKTLTSLLKPLFKYAEPFGRPLTVNEEEKKIFTTITAMLDKAACLIYLSFVRKMDDEVVLSLKNSLSELLIEETHIMKMYLILDIDSTRNLESHVSMSLRLLEWNKKYYLGIVTGTTLEDHFMSIKQGLLFLLNILRISYNEDLKRRIQHLVSIVKQKLHSFPHNQKDATLVVNLENAYGELREEMQNVVIKPGTDDYTTLFPKSLKEGHSLRRPKDFLLEKIKILVTSSCKTDQITPVMKELEELRRKLTSLKPLFDTASFMPHTFAVKEDEEKIVAALTSFLDRATCLIYLSFVGKLNEDMLVSVRKNFSLLIIEGTEIKKMSAVLGIFFEDDLESDIDISLSLLKRLEEYHMCTVNEAMLKDHIISMKHGVEFLKWIFKIYKDKDLKRSIILLVGNVKQNLELLTYKQGDGGLNMDVNGAFVDLREEMKNVFINPAIGIYDTLFPEFSQSIYHYRGKNSDFLIEKILTLVTSNCKADQIAPLRKELQDLLKILTFLKPLGLYVDSKIPWLGGKIFTSLLTIHYKATFLIYLSYVGKIDIEMAFLVKSNISIAIKETDVREIYTLILNEFLSKSDYLESELYLLQNLILLLKSNVEYLNDVCSKLYEVLIDIHSFLLGLYPNVLLRKLHLLLPSFQAILGYSIPIVCSCYLEHTELDVSADLNCVLDLIKRIKSEAQEIKLYYFPRTDDLGFLEFFTDYLVDLMKNQKMSMKEEIDALRFEVHSLLCLAKVRNQEDLNETPWTDIINMAYQAEYIIDLYLASSSRDLGLIASLSKITAQLKNIRADVHDLCCKSLPIEDVAVTSQPQALGMVTQVIDNQAIVGLQEKARMIMEDLLKGETKLDVISIIGMAGVGKTTLALTLFKSTPLMVDHFDILAWCTISQSYRTRDLLLSILDQVNASVNSRRSISDDQELADHNHIRMSDDQDLVGHNHIRMLDDQALADYIHTRTLDDQEVAAQNLADQLCRSLKKRRYLIVLDDIWDNKWWNYLKRYLPDDGTGSRILITTRNRDVAVQIGSKVNELRGLSKESSWELFQKKMLAKESFSNDLLKISKEIVSNCKGLPLSIVIIAGILSGVERTEKMWNEVAESVSSSILSDPQGKCKAILELSYNHLPNHLRSCFLYLGSFPEDQEISVNHLIMRWIAEGLIRDTKADSAEEVAKKYMDDLIVKSLVIPAKERSRGGVKTFRLHDLLRDFCLDKARENHFFTVLDQSNDSRPLQDPRRLIINGPLIKGLHFSCHSIRSMICFDGLGASEIKKGIGYHDMVLLKVLEVWLDIFPNISNLIHLRYLALGLEDWEISILPSSICRLHNLQILILRCGNKVIQVPDIIWGMVKLRHVHIRSEASFQADINRFQNSPFLLENLRSLSKARVSCGDSEWLIKLFGLEKLSCVFVDDDLEDDKFRMLSFNGHLTSLKVGAETAREQRFLSTCHLPISLRKLTLTGFYLTSNDISKIGALSHLEVFKLYDCYLSTGQVWNVDDGDFWGLKVLKLRDLDISKWIVSEDSFPSLEQLWVEKCDYLDEIPLDFGYLVKLRSISVRECAPSVDDSAREIEKMQHDDQNTEMKVHIYPRKW